MQAINWTLVGLALTATSAASAATTPIAADASQNWAHAESKIGFPAKIGSFARESVEDSTSSQSDIIVTYRDDASKTLVSIYLFRAGVVDVSLWQDRIEQQIVRHDGPFGTVDGEHGRGARFTPPGGGVDSGYRVVFPVSGKEATATGSALAAMDDWLVAIRMTSRQLTAVEVDEKLASLMAALAFPQAKRPATPAYRMADCADRTLPDKNAKRADTDMASVLIMGAMQMSAREPDAADSTDTLAIGPFCRVASGGSDLGVYRAQAARDRYLVAFGDAGVVAEVAPDAGNELLGKARQFGLTLTTSERSMFFRGFKSLPPVAQVVATLNSEGPIGGTGRTPQTAKTINISAPGK